VLCIVIKMFTDFTSFIDPIYYLHKCYHGMDAKCKCAELLLYWRFFMEDFYKNFYG
jgi:hypothetical protein